MKTIKEHSLLLVAIALGVLLRLVYLEQPIRYDEALSYFYFSGDSLIQVTHSYIIPNNHVFHNLLTWGLLQIIDVQLWSLRFVAFAAGIACIPCAYAIGVVYFNRNIAAFFALLVACSSYLIEYSTNARGYTLICLFSMVYMLIFSNFIQRGKIAWFAFVVVTTLGAYTIPTMLYPAGGFGLAIVACFAHQKQREFWKANLVYLLSAGAIIGVSVGILYFPIIRTQGIEVLTGNQWVTAEPSFQSFFHSMQTQLIEFSRFLFRTEYSLFTYVLLVLSLSGLPIVYHWNKQLFSLILFSFAFLFVFSAYRMAFPFPRVLTYCMPLFLLLLAVLFEKIFSQFRSSKQTILAIAIFGGLSIDVIFSHKILNSRETGSLDRMRDIISYLERTQSDSPILAVTPSDFPLLFSTLSNPKLNDRIMSSDFGYGVAPNRVFEKLIHEPEFYIIEDRGSGQDKHDILKHFGFKGDEQLSEHIINESISVWKYKI